MTSASVLRALLPIIKSDIRSLRLRTSLSWMFPVIALASPAPGQSFTSGRGSGMNPSLTLQPSAGELRAAQSGDDVRAVAHQLPDELRAIILDHQDDRALIESAVTG